MLRLNDLTGLAASIRQLPFLRTDRSLSGDEIDLYYRRACLAAAEERYDSALIFCAKAWRLDPCHQPSRLLAAQIHHMGVYDFEAAISGYRKLIGLAGYDDDNPYCAAARRGLEELLRESEMAVEASL